VRQRLPILLSATALIVAVLGSTGIGHSAVQAVVPPFAKTAGYAKFSGDSTKLNGRRSSLAGAAGSIPVVGKNGKLPAAIGAVGPQGPAGPAGATGAKGLAGPPGIAEYQIVAAEDSSPTTLSGSGAVSATCPTGKSLIGGGGTATRVDGSFGGDSYKVVASWPASATSWTVRGYKTSGSGGLKVTAWAICAQVEK
jgi:hypothetical protein